MENTTYGKYLLLDRIAVGGMAEVFKGKIIGDQGFEKQIVLKKMLPQVAENEEMVNYFIDEAKLAALLQHENIIHVYDFGELEGGYFIAMEYLAGQDLHAVMNKAKRQKKEMDLTDILWIVSQICDGLAYAHTLKDLHGQALNLVHRDISPQNIFITYDGNVKILDFGIAKTSVQSTQTKVGVAKGKMSYMSPEQLEAKSIDFRSDIFALGILLYEMVSQTKMYQGDTAEVFKKVIQADYEPILSRVPDLNPDAAQIVSRALQKDVDQRFQTCQDMQSAIDDAIFKIGNRPNKNKLAAYIQTLFPVEYKKSNGFTQKDNDKQNDSETTGTVVLDAHTDGKTKVIDEVDETVLVAPPRLSGIFSIYLNRFNALDKKMRIGIGGAAVIIVCFILLFSLSPFKKGDHSGGGKHNSTLAENKKEATYSKEIQDLFAKAENAIAKKQLTTPKNDSAYYYFLQIENKVGRIEKVIKGYQKLADMYALYAESNMKNYHFDTARSNVKKGLSIVPDHERLLALKKELGRSKPGLFFKNLDRNIKDTFKKN